MGILGLIFLLISASICGATDYYISPSGSDSSNGLTQGAPVQTFAHAFSLMSASDRLLLLDGTYTTAVTGGIDTTPAPSGQPPNGSSKAAPTIIQAVNGPGHVIIEQRLYLGTSVTKKSYIKIDGIKFEGISGLYNTSYCYIKNCSFTANTLSNAAILSIGTGDHANGNDYALIEDCWAVGQQRIGMIAYNTSYTVFRRCVIRTDGCNYSSGNPSVGITVYSTHHASVQNVIVLDRLSGAGVDGQNFAGVQASPAGLFGQVEWAGCINLGGEENGWMIEPSDTLTDDDYTFKLVNCVSVGANYYGIGIQGTGVQHDVLIDHCAAFNNGSSGIRMAPNSCTDPIVQNSLSEGSGVLGFYIACTGTSLIYNQAYNNTSGDFSPTGTNNTSQASTALYPLQPGSDALDGNDAIKRGPTILKRYGTDGTFYGDSGYNTLTETDLWPWPNEDQIKIDFSEDIGTSDETRGFCDGTSIGGSTQTLTRYVWEYLGNQIPEDIYGSGTTTASNRVGAGTATRLQSGTSITIGAE